METTSIAGKESYLTEGGSRERQENGQNEQERLHATISQLATTIAALPARQERREIFMAVRLLLEGVSLIPKRAPDTHTQNKRGCADEAQYCRGARYARKSRTRTAVK